MGWRTDWKEKLMSQSSERTGAKTAWGSWVQEHLWG